MRLYGALSELAELIIRLASGKTTKIESSEQSATSGEATVTIPDVGTGGSDEFVMKATTQTLTSKTLTEPVLNSAEINNSVKLQTPSDGTPAGTNYSHVGALGFNTTDNKLIVGDGSNIRKFVDDGAVEANDQNSTYIQDVHKKRLLSSTIEDTNMLGGYIGSQNKTTAIEYVNKIGLSKVGGTNGLPAQHVLVVDANQELASESALAKVRGGIGADATNILFPASGTLVTEAGTQTLTNKTLENATVSGYEDFAHTTTPAADPTGAVRVYAKSDNKLYTLSPAGIEQAVGSGGSVLLIAKVGHGFTAADVGCPVYLDLNGDYVKAKADAANTAEVAGLINKFVDADNFEVCLGGEVESVGANAIASLVPGELYFLSATDAGKLTATEPAVVGQVSKPVGIARTASKLDFFNMRGVVVGAANARTTLAVSNNAATNVVDVTSYNSLKLEGELNVTRSSGGNQRAYYTVEAAKNGAGVWQVSASYTGDDVLYTTLPAWDVAANQLQVTMPNVTNFSSASLTYALGAPAVGASLPLSIDSSSINIVESAPLSNRNRIINGGMDIWQRGDNTTGSGFFADRWRIESGVTTAVENAGGSAPGFRRNAYIRRNVSGNAVVAQRIEAANCFDLAGKSVTVQLHHTTASGSCTNIAVSIYRANSMDTFSGTTLVQTINITDTSTGTKTVTFNALPSEVANGIELRIDYTVVGDTYVRLTGVQLEVGSKATAFEKRPFQQELALCQRYFEKSYNLNVPPGTNVSAGANVCSITSSVTSLSRLFFDVRYAVPKRTTAVMGSSVNPIKIYSEDGTVNAISVYNSSATKLTVTSVGASSFNSLGTFISTSTNAATGQAYYFHWTAEAEL